MNDYYAKSSTLCDEDKDNRPIAPDPSIAAKLDEIEITLHETCYTLMSIIAKTNNAPSPDDTVKKAECLQDRINSIGSFANDCMSMAHVIEQTYFG
jgi:hypothetical protein